MILLTTNARILRAGFATILLMGFSTLLSTTVHAQTTTTYATSGFVSPQTGNTLAGQAVFTIITPGTLQIDVTNTSTGTGKMDRGDILGTLLFSFANSVTVATADGASNTTTSLLSGSSVINSNDTSAASSQAVNGSWIFGKQTDGDRKYNYGVSASGFGNTATGGAVNATSNGVEAYSFASSGMTLGGGGDDYMLVRPTLTGINGGSVPVIKSGVRINLTGLTGLTSTSQITKVGFGYASGAFTTGMYNIAVGTSSVVTTVPEASTFQLLPGGLVIGMLLLKRRMNKLKN